MELSKLYVLGWREPELYYWFWLGCRTAFFNTLMIGIWKIYFQNNIFERCSAVFTWPFDTIWLESTFEKRNEWTMKERNIERVEGCKLRKGWAWSQDERVVELVVRVSAYESASLATLALAVDAADDNVVPRVCTRNNRPEPRLMDCPNTHDPNSTTSPHLTPLHSGRWSLLTRRK